MTGRGSVGTTLGEYLVDVLSLTRAHVETLFTHDDRGRMVRVNEPHGPPAPRFLLARTVEGDVIRLRHDVDPDIAEELEHVCRRNPSGDIGAVSDSLRAQIEEVLSRTAPVRKRWAGPAWRFPVALPDDVGVVSVDTGNAHVLETHLSEWLEDVERSQPLVVVLEGAHAVSVCCSVRRGSRAHEAGVETAPAYRGRGHAVRAAAGWAREVRRAGLTPLYSTSWENAASRSVAAKLAFVQFCADVHFT